MIKVDDCYVIKRMVPPHTFKFFFSTGPNYNFICDLWPDVEGKTIPKI